jgi:hypothetical protein
MNFGNKVCALLAAFFLFLPQSLAAKDIKVYGEWSFGNMNSLGLIWTCAGSTASSNGLLLLSYYGINGNEISQLVYFHEKLPKKLPSKVLIVVDSENFELSTWDYAERPENELSFLPMPYEDEYFSAMKKANSISFNVSGQVIGPFSLKGFSKVIDYMKGCFGTSGFN